VTKPKPKEFESSPIPQSGFLGLKTIRTDVIQLPKYNSSQE